MDASLLDWLRDWLSYWLADPLGLYLQSHQLGAAHMALRAFVVYVVAVAIFRMAKKRFLGQATAFDMILVVILGSVVSRAITGNAPFLPVLGAAIALMLAHWAFSGVSARWHLFGLLVKGAPTTIIKHGKVDRRALTREHMSDRDLDEQLRAHGVRDPEDVAEARLERNGQLSVVRAQPPRGD